jgi:drug/metabolite transporter (DMT)-like permease
VQRWGLLILRGVLGGTAVLFYFLAISHLPVGTATLLNYTAPIFTTTFAALFLDEAVTPATLVALVAASFGVCLVVYGQGRALGGAYVWLAIGLISAVISGGAIATIRAARRTEGAWEVFLSVCVVGALFNAPLALHGWKAPTPGGWALLATVGLLATVAQLLLTHALATVEAASAGIISQLTVVTALALGHFMDGEPFGLLSVVGGALTLAGVSLVSAAPAMRSNISH